jgi:hypothetical protein
MKTGIQAVLFGVAVSTAAVLLLSVQPEPPIEYSVCEVARQAERFDGKIVRIRGNVVSGMETGGLSDSSCSAFILVDNFATLPSGLQGPVCIRQIP